MGSYSHGYGDARRRAFSQRRSARRRLFPKIRESRRLRVRNRRNRRQGRRLWADDFSWLKGGTESASFYELGRGAR